MAQANNICRAQVFPFANNQRHAANDRDATAWEDIAGIFLSGRALGDQNVGVIAGAICSNGND